MTIEDLRHRLEEGMTISYYPDNGDRVRDTGVVRSHYGGDISSGVVVVSDEEGEIRVPYENVRAIES